MLCFDGTAFVFLGMEIKNKNQEYFTLFLSNINYMFFALIIVLQRS